MRDSNVEKHKDNKTPRKNQQQTKIDRHHTVEYFPIKPQPTRQTMARRGAVYNFNWRVRRQSGSSLRLSAFQRPLLHLIAFFFFVFYCPIPGKTFLRRGIRLLKLRPKNVELEPQQEKPRQPWKTTVPRGRRRGRFLQSRRGGLE